MNSVRGMRRGRVEVPGKSCRNGQQIFPAALLGLGEEEVERGEGDPHGRGGKALVPDRRQAPRPEQEHRLGDHEAAPACRGGWCGINRLTHVHRLLRASAIDPAGDPCVCGNNTSMARLLLVILRWCLRRPIMQVSFTSAYLRVSDRRTQVAGEALQASEPQRLADMPGAKPVDTATVPALSELRWIADGLQVVTEVRALAKTWKVCRASETRSRSPWWAGQNTWSWPSH
jgi:hypothetical protein